MAKFRLRFIRAVAVGAGSCLMSASLMPGLAIACSGSSNVKIVKPTTPFDFGKVKVGTEASQVFEVENVPEVTYETIKLKKLIGSGMSLGTKVATCTGKLSPNSKCKIEVVYKPTVTGNSSFFLEIPFEAAGVKEETDGTINGEGI